MMTREKTMIVTMKGAMNAKYKQMVRVMVIWMHYLTAKAPQFD